MLRKKFMLGLLLFSISTPAFSKTRLTEQDEDPEHIMSSFGDVDAGETSLIREMLSLDWSEIENKLKQMDWPQIEYLSGTLTGVIFEVQHVADAALKLRNGGDPDDDEKMFIILMAEKYGIDNPDALRRTIDKETYGRNDSKYLILKIQEIFKRQRRCAELFVKIQTWLLKRIPGMNVTYSPHNLLKIIIHKRRLIRSFENVAEALRNYESTFE